MEIPGFAISADIELLRQEIDNYRKSLGITDEIITKLCDDEENPALEAAWELIFYDDGIHSILRQTAMELDPEDLINFAKKIPILGGGISFPATCRYTTNPKPIANQPKIGVNLTRKLTQTHTWPTHLGHNRPRLVQNQGGNTEFNFSALKFVLQELSEMALRYVSRDLTECESLGSIGDSGSLATSRDNVSLCSNSSFNEY